MVGAVSLNPYVSGYQYTGGLARTRATGQNPQVQAGQGIEAASGARAVSTGRSNGASSLIGARSIVAAGQASAVAGVSAGRGADPEGPIQPVDAVSVLEPAKSGSTNYMIPFLRQGMDPAELAVRMRIQYSDTGAAGQLQRSGAERAVGESAKLNLPGSAQGADPKSVLLDLPGDTLGTGKAREAGLPGAESETDSQNVDSGKDATKTAGLSTGNTERMTEETECKTCKERKYQDGSNDPGVSFKTPAHIEPGQSASVVRGHEMEHVVNERARAKNEGRRVISQSVTMQTGICPECGRVYTVGGVTRTTTAAEPKQEEQPKDPRWILAASA